MDTLDRYLVKETLTYLILVLLGIAMLFLGIDFLTNFWRSHYPLTTTLQMYVYRLPGALQMFIPVACLMSTLLVLTSMSRQNEILALNASGVGTIRIVSTFIALVATFSTVGFLVLDPTTAVFNRKRILVSQGLNPDSQENLSSFNRSNFWHRSGRLVYNVGQFVPETNTLRDLKIYLFTPSFYLLERIEAKEAHFENDDWVLLNGMIVTYPPDTQYPEAMPFKTKRNVIPEKPRDFKTFQVREETMRLRDLRQFVVRNRQFGLDTTAQQVSYHERVAAVFTPLVLVLLGIPFALKPLKNHSATRSVAFCFGIVFIYLLMSRLTISIGKSGHIAPFVAAWAPNLLFLAFAGFRLMRS